MRGDGMSRDLDARIGGLAVIKVLVGIAWMPLGLSCWSWWPALRLCGSR